MTQCVVTTVVTIFKIKNKLLPMGCYFPVAYNTRSRILLTAVAGTCVCFMSLSQNKWYQLS